jgi:hypothetical protein
MNGPGRSGTILAALLWAGCGSPGGSARDYTPTVARFYLEVTDAPGATVELPVSGVRLGIGAKPVLTEGDVVAVELMQVELGRCLMFQLTPAAARDLFRLSGASQGRRLVLLLNQVPVGARRIDGPIGDGRIFLFVEVAEPALPALVANLQQTTADFQRTIARAK